ncbi:hypothetical protein BHE74_00028627 [Ensete ventricosum]|nr:hypothetical protein BHE74_00028627 [Ensete ventricosum]
MTYASSHSESYSVEVLTYRSRALGHPSGDSRSTIILSSSGGAALVNSGAAEALTVMQSGFNVDSTMTTRQLVEVRKNYYISLEYKLHAPLSSQCPYDAFLDGFNLSTDALEVGLKFPLHPVIVALLGGLLWEMFNLGKMKSGSGVGSGSTAPSSAAMVVVVPTTGKLPGIDMGASLKKRSNRAAPEEPVDASKSTTEVPAGGGREPVGRRLRKSPSGGSTRVWTEGLLVEEYLRGALHPTLAKKVYECSSEKIMNRAANLDGARDDRARLEGDVLSLTKAATLLEAELKAEGPKAVAAYNAFEGSSRASRRWGQISYEFRYRVALEWLGERHPEVEVKNDPFAKCLEDGNVKIDLCQPFDDNAPSEK